jgi:hypothetical protein
MNTFWEIIKNSPVQLGSLIVAVISFLAFTWWRQRKEFSYRIISDYPLFDVNKQFSDRVKILFDDKQVDRVSLVVVEFLNNGWMPIKATDFEVPVEVCFGEKSEIMNVEIIKRHPKGLSPNVIASGSKLTIGKKLFNRGNLIQLKILVHNYSGAIEVTGHIEEVPEIKRVSSTFGPGIRIVFFFMWVLGAFASLRVEPVESVIVRIVAIGMFLLFALFFDYILRNARPRKLRIYSD